MMGDESNGRLKLGIGDVPDCGGGGCGMRSEWLAGSEWSSGARLRFFWLWVGPDAGTASAIWGS